MEWVDIPIDSYDYYSTYGANKCFVPIEHNLQRNWRVTYICSSANNSENGFSCFCPFAKCFPLYFSCFGKTDVLQEGVVVWEQTSEMEKRVKGTQSQIQYDKFCQSLKSMCDLWTILLLLCFADSLVTFCGRFLKQLRLFSVVGPQSCYWDVFPSTMLLFAFSKESKSVKIVHFNAG